MRYFLSPIHVACIACCGWLAVIPAVNGSPQDESSEMQLPPHAIWRFGAIDDTDAPGYYRLKFSPDGKFLAARNRANMVEVRDCDSRQLICEIGGYDSKVNWIDFSVDGQYLLTAGDASEHVRIWEIKSGRLAHEIVCRPSYARFSLDGKSIIVLEKTRSFENREARVYSKVLTYSWPGAMFVKHQVLGRRLDYLSAISPSSRFLVGSQKTNRKISLSKLIDIENDSAVILDGPPDPPDQLSFSPDENWLVATYHRRNSVRLWSLHDPTGQKFELTGHAQTVKSATFSDDSRFLVTTGWDKQVVVWDLLTREPIARLAGHDEHVIASAFRPLRFQLATGSTGLNDSTVILWDLNQIFFSDEVETIEKPEFAKTWRSLGASEPKTALANLDRLRHSPDNVFELIREKLVQPMAVSRDQLLQWIGQLDAKSFLEREQATRELMAVRGSVERLLIEELESAISTERYYRITEILKQPVSRPAINKAELRRIHRGILLLELIVNDDEFGESALQLLKSLAQNHPHVDICRDATAALNRIQFRSQLKIR